MKLLTSLTLIILFLGACTKPTTSEETKEDIVSFPERAKAMNIYEVNIRQYTPEGTINAFRGHLPEVTSHGS